MKTIARILPIAAAMVAGLGMFACSRPSSPEPPASNAAPAATPKKSGPRWAFVEVGFQITREGKIMDVKVLASDAPAKARKQAVGLIHNYVPLPKIYNRVARQTLIYDRKTGKFRPMRLEVHSSQSAGGG